MGNNRVNPNVTELERRLAMGQTAQVKDRLGRDLHVGDLVSMPLSPQHAAHVVWRIAKIVKLPPSVDPRQGPQELVQIHMTAHWNLVTHDRRQPTNEIVRVAEAREVDAPAEAPEGEAPVPDAPAPAPGPTRLPELPAVDTPPAE